MTENVNLDRAVIINITYPIGVKETGTFTWDHLVTLDDTYQILISKKSGDLVDTINETDAALTRVDNKLVWDINYERGGLLIVDAYNYEVRNVTQDYREVKGIFSVTETINHG